MNNPGHQLALRSRCSHPAASHPCLPIIKSLLLLALTGLAIIGSALPAAHADTWWVDDDSWGGNGSRMYPFTFIFQAVDAASPGDTIMVLDGFNYGTEIRKPELSITAYETGTVTILGQFWIHADLVSLDGFVLINDQPPESGSYGVLLDNVRDCTITNNQFTQYGVTIRGGLVEQWNTHTIEGNTVNGAPLRYYRDANGLTVPLDTGQLILGNCTNVIARDLDIANVASCIQLGFGSANMVANCTVSSHFGDGLILVHSDRNSITGNEIDDAIEAGILIHASADNEIAANNFGAMPGTGLRLWHGAARNRVLNNTLSDTGNGAIWLKYSASANEISGNTLVRSNHGIMIDEDSSNNVVSFNLITDVDQSAIDIRRRCHGNVIQGNTVVSPEWWGIVTYSSALHTVIRDNTLEHCGLELWGDASTLETYVVENNMANGRPIYFFKNRTNLNVPLDAAQVFLVSCSNSTISSLFIYDVQTGIQITNCNGIHVTNNRIENNKDSGVAVYFSSEVAVTNNDIIGNQYVGALVMYSDDITVTDNMVIGNGGGVSLRAGARNHIRRNLVSDGEQVGIYLSYLVKDTVVSDNIVINNGWYGIALWWDADRNLISNNEVFGNLKGISVEISRANRIFGNVCRANVEDGIFIDGSLGNLVVGNSVSGNTRGIVLDARNRPPSTGNRIYHNNVFDNQLEAGVDPFEGNVWHSGYPGGGNYWHPMEPRFDDFHGPNQDQFGPDDIVDRGLPDGGIAPYSENGVYDPYPFVDMNGWRSRSAGDLNCDGEINSFDIEPFLLALFDPAEYATQYSDCDIDLADVNGDGSVDAFDIEPFLDLLFDP